MRAIPAGLTGVKGIASRIALTVRSSRREMVKVACGPCACAELSAMAYHALGWADVL